MFPAARPVGLAPSALTSFLFFRTGFAYEIPIGILNVSRSQRISAKRCRPPKKIIAFAQIMIFTDASVSVRIAQIGESDGGGTVKFLFAATALAGSFVSSFAHADMVFKAAVSGANCDPYTHYSCLDAYLGDDFLTRLARYYQLEMGHDGPPSDPKAPPSRRSDAVWPPTPESTPPMPFTEWPYGGSPAIGVTRQVQRTAR
jgi:hypothetical protein